MAKMDNQLQHLSLQQSYLVQYSISTTTATTICRGLKPLPQGVFLPYIYIVYYIDFVHIEDAILFMWYISSVH